MIVMESKKGKPVELLNTEIDEFIAEGREKMEIYNWLTKSNIFTYVDAKIYRRQGSFYAIYKDSFGRTNHRFLALYQVKPMIKRMNKKKFVELFGGIDEDEEI